MADLSRKRDLFCTTAVGSVALLSGPSSSLDDATGPPQRLRQRRFVAAAVGSWLKVYDASSGTGGHDGHLVAEVRAFDGRRGHGIRQLAGPVVPVGFEGLIAVFGENRFKVYRLELVAADAGSSGSSLGGGCSGSLKLCADLTGLGDWILDAQLFAMSHAAANPRQARANEGRDEAKVGGACVGGEAGPQVPMTDAGDAAGASVSGQCLVAIGLAQNVVEIWDPFRSAIVASSASGAAEHATSGQCLQRVRCEERSLLYSMSILPHHDSGLLLVASGTIMGSVALWAVPMAAGTVSSDTAATGADAAKLPGEVGRPAARTLPPAPVLRVQQRLRGHRGSIFGISWDPDAAHLATVSDDRTVRYWAVDETPMPTRVEAEPASAGRANACASMDISTASPPPLSRPFSEQWSALGHGSRVWRSALTGRWVVTVGEDSTCRVWHRASGALATTLRGHAGKHLRALAVDHREGRWLATGGPDGTVKLWDLDWQVEAASTPETWRHTHLVRPPPPLLLPSDGQVAAALRQSPQDSQIPRRSPPLVVRIVRLFDQGRALVCISKCGAIWRWQPDFDVDSGPSEEDVAQGGGQWAFLGTAAAHSDAASPGDSGNTDKRQPKKTKQAAGDDVSASTAAAVAGPAADCAAAAPTSSAGACSTKAGATVHAPSAPEEKSQPDSKKRRPAAAGCAAVSGDHRWLVVGDTAGGCALFDLSANQLVCRFQAHRSRVTHIYWDSAVGASDGAGSEAGSVGASFATSSFDGSIHIWRIAARLHAPIDAAASGVAAAGAGSSIEGIKGSLRPAAFVAERVAQLAVNAKGGAISVLFGSVGRFCGGGDAATAQSLDRLLCCGDARGNVHLFAYSDCQRGPGAGDMEPPGPSSCQIGFVRAAHGTHPVTFLGLPADRSGTLLSGGADGRVIEYDLSAAALEQHASLAATAGAGAGAGGGQMRGALRAIAHHRIAGITTVEHVWSDPLGGIVVAGFHGTNFLVTNISSHQELLRVSCGGRKRPYSFYLAPDHRWTGGRFVLAATPANATGAAAGRGGNDGAAESASLRIFSNHAISVPSSSNGDPVDGVPRITSPSQEGRVARNLGVVSHGKLITAACWITSPRGADEGGALANVGGGSDDGGHGIGQSTGQPARCLVTCGEDNAVKLWADAGDGSMASLRCIQTDTNAHTAGIRCLAVSRGHGSSRGDGETTFVFSGGGGNTICCWDLSSAAGGGQLGPWSRIQEYGRYSRPDADQEQRVLDLSAFSIPAAIGASAGVPGGAAGRSAVDRDHHFVVAGDSEGVCRLLHLLPMPRAPRDREDARELATAHPAVAVSAMAEVCCGTLGGPPVRSVAHIVWPMSQGQPQQEPRADAVSVASSAVPNLALVFGGSTGGRVRVWDVTSRVAHTLACTTTSGTTGTEDDSSSSSSSSSDSGGRAGRLGVDASAMDDGPADAGATMVQLGSDLPAHQAGVNAMSVIDITAHVSTDGSDGGGGGGGDESSTLLQRRFRLATVGDDQRITIATGCVAVIGVVEPAATLTWLSVTQLDGACGSALQAVRQFQDYLFVVGWNQRLSVWALTNGSADEAKSRTTEATSCTRLLSSSTEIADATSLDVVRRDAGGREAYEVIIAGEGLHVMEVST